MGLRNEADRFGWPSRAIHWATAALVLAAVPLGLYIARAEVSLSTLWLFGLHKTLGVTVLALTLLRVLWHRVTPPPAPLPSSPATDRLARSVHAGLYAALLLLPLSGWMASSATGIDTVIFDRWTLPRIAPVSETWETAGFAVHRAAGYALIALVALHVAGALHRALGVRDRTLHRILLGR